MLQTQIRKLIRTRVPILKIGDELNCCPGALFSKQSSEEIFILDSSVTDLQEDIIGYISVTTLNKHRQPLIQCLKTRSHPETISLFLQLFSVLHLVIDKLGLKVSTFFLSCLEVDTKSMTIDFSDETVFELIECKHEDDNEGSRFVEVVEREKSKVKAAVLADIKQMLTSLYNENQSIQMVYQAIMSVTVQHGVLAKF